MKSFAVAICCDTNYLPISCFLANQIVDQTPDVSFDICICSSEHLEIPADLKAKGVKSVHLPIGQTLYEQKSTHLPVSAYLHLWLPDLLGDSYEKILYLDSDMMLEGGHLAEVFETDLQGRSVAAVRDMQQWLRPTNTFAIFAGQAFPQRPISTAV